MVRLNVLELLQRQGHSKYWLYKQLGMSYQNFNKMVNNETQSIKLERIETLCQLLNCTPQRPVPDRLGAPRLRGEVTRIISPSAWLSPYPWPEQRLSAGPASSDTPSAVPLRRAGHSSSS